MAIIGDIQKKIVETKKKLDSVQEIKKDFLVWDAFYKGFQYRFCWSSNSIEGNTLSLDETIAVVDFDEVSAGHKFSEYQDAKNLFRAIKEMSPKGVTSGSPRNGSKRSTVSFVGRMGNTGRKMYSSAILPVRCITRLNMKTCRN